MGDIVVGKGLPGMIGEIRLWNQARSASEIKSNMTRRLEKNVTHLVANWRFDKGRVVDFSQQRNDGFLVSSPQILMFVPRASSSWGFSFELETSDAISSGVIDSKNKLILTTPHKKLKVVAKTVSNSQGDYQFNQLRGGKYRLRCKTLHGDIAYQLPSKSILDGWELILSEGVDYNVSIKYAVSDDIHQG